MHHLSVNASLVAQIPSYIPTDGLVAWYPFNGNANDESGNGNSGTVNGATLTTDKDVNNYRISSLHINLNDYIVGLIGYIECSVVKNFYLTDIKIQKERVTEHDEIYTFVCEVNNMMDLILV